MRDPVLASARAELSRLGAATVGESGGLPMAARLRPVWPGAAVTGPAYPVSCRPGDNLALHAAVASAPAGSVLVVDVGSLADRGYFGEVLATGAQARGIRGLVIDGCVRDIEALQRVAFPVFARGASLPGATKMGGGAIGSAISVGGVTVVAGDYIVADTDGVVVVPTTVLLDVIEAGKGREAKEADMFVQLKSGATTVELLGLDTSPVASGSCTGLGLTNPGGVVLTANAPVPSGGYSQARWAGDLLHLAGVGPYDPATREIVGADITEQTVRAVANAQATLTESGLGLENVISTLVFLADLDRDWRGFDAAYSAAMPSPYPSRAMVGAALKGILVELVMIADGRR